MENNEKELRELIFEELRTQNLKCGQVWVFGQINTFVHNLLKKYYIIAEETLKKMVNENYFKPTEPEYKYTSHLVLTEKCENEIYKI